MIRRIISLIMIIQISLLSLVYIPLSSPLVSGQYLEPSVVISFLEYEKTAKYSGEYAEVTFNGLANVTIVPGTRVIVSFSASDTWNSVIVSPNTLLFAENGEQTFSVNVKVPPNKEYQSEGRVTVDGFWQMYPGTFSGYANQVTGRIIVGQYYNFTLSSENQKIEVPEESETELELTITNGGNNIDTFSINVKNQQVLSGQGFRIELGQTNIEISAGLSDTVTITVKTPSKRDALIENQIIIEVYSDQGIQQEVDAKDFSFEIKMTEKDQTIPEVFSWGIILIFIILTIAIIMWRYKRRTKYIE